MSLLVFAIVVCIVAGLLIWACDYVPFPAPMGIIFRVFILILAAVIILNRAGLT